MGINRIQIARNLVLIIDVDDNGRDIAGAALAIFSHQHCGALQHRAGIDADRTLFRDRIGPQHQVGECTDNQIALAGDTAVAIMLLHGDSVTRQRDIALLALNAAQHQVAIGRDFNAARPHQAALVAHAHAAFRTDQLNTAAIHGA